MSGIESDIAENRQQRTVDNDTDVTGLNIYVK